MLSVETPPKWTTHNPLSLGQLQHHQIQGGSEQLSKSSMLFALDIALVYIQRGMIAGSRSRASRTLRVLSFH